MARQDQKTPDRRTGDPRPQGGDGYGGERGNEFGGEGRFRAEGGHGSHFGGEPDVPGETAGPRSSHPNRNTDAWRGDRRQEFVEKFDRWRSERAARTANRGPVSAPDASAHRQTGRSAKK